MAAASIPMTQPVESCKYFDDDDDLLLIDNHNEENYNVNNCDKHFKNTRQPTSHIEVRTPTDNVFLSPDSRANSFTSNTISGQRRFRADPNFINYGNSYRRQPQVSITDHYYGQSEYTDPTPFTSTNTDEIEQGNVPNAKPHSNTNQSRRLPQWAWKTICYLLGVPVRAVPMGNTPRTLALRCTSKPWLGMFIQIITIITALVFAVTFTCYTAYDIKNIYTNQTLMMGVVHIVLAVYWCVLGLYSRSRAASMFQCSRFAASVRVHSKTIFKLSSAGVLILLTSIVIVLNNIDSSYTYSSHACHKVGLHPALCQVMYISRVFFSVLALVWNMMVAVMLLSVCRTHTIGIRRFIRELEGDGFVYEMLQRNSLVHNETMTEACSIDDDDDDDYVWDDDIPQTLTQDMPHSSNISRQQQIQQMKQLNNNSRRRRSTLSLPASASGCGSVGGRSSTFLSSENIAQSNLVNGGTNTTQPANSSSQTIASNAVPSIVIGDNVMVDYGNMEMNGDTANLASPHSKDNLPRANSLQETDRNNFLDPSVIGSNHFGVSLELDEPRDGIDGASSTMAHAPPPNEGLPDWRKFTASRQRATSSDIGATDNNSIEDMSISEIQIMSKNAILLSYWKISCRLRTTSLVLQRWLMAVLTFIVMWNMTYVIHWVSHEVTAMGIAQVIIPLLLLPLICSAYAEVNMEGRRMIKCVCPTSGRLDMLFYLIRQPLEITVYGFPINYSTIVKAVGAMILAFCTRLILDEVNA